MVSDIGKIKTKHSAGPNIWIGAIAGVGAGALIGKMSGNGNSEEDMGTMVGDAAGILVGALLIGPALGAAAGGATALLKNSKTFIINGSIQNWEDFQSHAEERLAVSR
ncbi:MAG: hypothetical protein M9904_02170 [Chitinophagaceae bacterium]|nr:hypothetical protein [Chitinophagaceae bacterium]